MFCYTWVCVSYMNARLTAIFHDNLGKPVPAECLHSGFYRSQGWRRCCR